MLKVILATAAVTLAALPAAAATMKAVYTGTVYSSYDQTGVFGGSGSSLDGLGYELTYIYDTSKGTRSTASGYDQVIGGSAYANESPISSAVLKINGKQWTFDGLYSGNVYVTSSGETTGYYHLAQDYFSEGSTSTSSLVYMYSYFLETVVPDLDLPAVLEVGEISYNSQFQVNEYDSLTGGYFAYANGSLTEDRLEISRYNPNPSPVPLPASFGLLLAGAAALGALKARRRSAA